MTFRYNSHMLFPAIIASCFPWSSSSWKRENFIHNLEAFQGSSPEISSLIFELTQFAQEFSWVLSDEEKRILLVLRNQFATLNSLLIGSRSWNKNDTRYIAEQFMTISSVQWSIITLVCWFYQQLWILFHHDISRLGFDEKKIRWSFLKESMIFVLHYILWRRKVGILWTTRTWVADILGSSSSSE